MVEIDFDDVRTLAVDVRVAGATGLAKIRPVVAKAGVNMKKAMRKDMRGSAYFKAAARSIDYELHDGGLHLETGPKREGAGNLAHIAYFGGANGGGSTVRDPGEHLDKEADETVKWIEKVLGDLL